MVLTCASAPSRFLVFPRQLSPGLSNICDFSGRLLGNWCIRNRISPLTFKFPLVVQFYHICKEQLSFFLSRNFRRIEAPGLLCILFISLSVSREMMRLECAWLADHEAWLISFILCSMELSMFFPPGCLGSGLNHTQLPPSSSPHSLWVIIACSEGHKPHCYLWIMTRGFLYLYYPCSLHHKGGGHYTQVSSLNFLLSNPSLPLCVVNLPPSLPPVFLLVEFSSSSTSRSSGCLSAPPSHPLWGSICRRENSVPFCLA